MDASFTPIDAGPRPDGGRPDASMPDAAGPDAARPDAAAPDSGADAGAQECRSHTECRDPQFPLCCADRVCVPDRCLSGIPHPSCEHAPPCGEGLVCVNQECGWATCDTDCRSLGDCGARGLTCDGDQCTFDCRHPEFAGCPDGTTCRENGRCGVPLCATAGCPPQEECRTPPAHALVHHDDGCRPRACEADGDCPGRGFCVEGGCHDVPGRCTPEISPPPSAVQIPH